MDFATKGNTLRKGRATSWKEAVILNSYMEQSFPELREIHFYFSDGGLGPFYTHNLAFILIHAITF
jgi:hypothetical protein